jgi:fimbrial chaperone protein
MRRAGIIAGVVALATAAPAFAEGRFQVEPTRIDLASAAPSGAVTVTNHGQSALRLQASVFRWTQDASGAMQLTAAPEMVVRPALFEVQPGKARTVRVGTTATAAAVEQSYRVFIEELPDRTATQAAGIHVLTRIGVPVFLAPRVAKVAIELAAVNDGGKPAVIVKNPGTLHVKLGAVKLRAADGGWEKTAAGWYVLPGDARRFPIEAGKACAAGDRWIAEAIDETGARWASAPSPCER